MLDLALHYGEGPVPLKEIAKRQEVSERYYMHIMKSLISAGLVRSTRGQRGGFSLTRAPKKIRLSEIVLSLEGPLSVVHCVSDLKVCHRAKECVTRDVWREIGKAILDILASKTLEDMVKSQKKKWGKK